MQYYDLLNKGTTWKVNESKSKVIFGGEEMKIANNYLLFQKAKYDPMHEEYHNYLYEIEEEI